MLVDIILKSLSIEHFFTTQQITYPLQLICREIAENWFAAYDLWVKELQNKESEKKNYIDN